MEKEVQFLKCLWVLIALWPKVREVLNIKHHTPTILITDDDASVRCLLRQMLERSQYQVLEAADGNEALQRLTESQIDMLITDLVMPGREGLELIRQIRREQPGLKVIAMSGRFGGSCLKAAELLGAHATLCKPLEIDMVLEAVRLHLE